MAEKKVILVVVEGKSDQAAFGTIFEEYFKDSKIQFQIVRGDITTQDYISSDSIIKKINDILIMLKNRYGYSFEVNNSGKSTYSNCPLLTSRKVNPISRKPAGLTRRG